MMNCANIPEMLTINEVRKRIPFLSYECLRRWCIQGKIVHVRIGNGKYLINFERLVDYLNTSSGGNEQ